MSNVTPLRSGDHLQLQERVAARDALRHGPDAPTVAERAWEPHRVCIAHSAADELYAVTVTPHDTDTATGSTATASLLLPNLWAARLVEAAVIRDTAHAARAAAHLAGAHCWDDQTAPPDLVAIAGALEREDLAWWRYGELPPPTRPGGPHPIGGQR